MSVCLFESIFFDLDGTLVDTAPDLAGAANKMRLDRLLPMINKDNYRPHASSGARGLLSIAFGITPEHRDFKILQEEFLRNYENEIHVESKFFEGIDELLTLLDDEKIPWGIITNKHSRYTKRLVKSIGLDKRTNVIVSGDTTPHAKPHPDPILFATKLARVNPETSIYIGDDKRDIEAGQAAGMKTMAAAYGYWPNNVPPNEWGADYIVKTPSDIKAILFS